MKTFVAVLLGLASGLFLYMMGAMVALAGPSAPAVRSQVMMALVVVLLLGGSIGSVVFLLRGASVPAVMRRGFLLGAWEWAAMGAACVVMTLRSTAAMVANVGASSALAAGATASGQKAAAIECGVSLVIAVVCAVCFRRMSREPVRGAGGSGSVVEAVA